MLKLSACKDHEEHVRDEIKIDPSEGRFFCCCFLPFFAAKILPFFAAKKWGFYLLLILKAYSE